MNYMHHIIYYYYRYNIVGCDSGSYQYNTYAQDSIPGFKYKYPVCSLCPKGSYQEDKGATKCNACPQHYSTTGKGSQSVEDCKGMDFMLIRD